MASKYAGAGPRSNKTARQILDPNFSPKNYKLDFSTDLSKLVFECDEKIEAEIKSPSNSISLNAADLKIMDAAVVSGGKRYKASVTYQKKLKRITLKFQKRLRGPVKINIKYTGINNSKMYGFYVATYELQNGKKERLLTSQFEAVDARSAFPCVDEPAAKATFEVSFNIDKDLEAISNMPVSSTMQMGSRKLVKFMKTPRMAPYLLYLGVGKFDKVSTSHSGIKVSMLSTPGNAKYSKLPLEYAKKFLSFYEKYFGIKYPLPKMDILAIPDFAAGAMENWGAVTFRETDLLCDESSPLHVKQNVAITIAHEFAHQWFGDLTTMEWWNDLWLNESFATMMSYKAVDDSFPEWDMGKKYLEDTFRVALSADQLVNTHPVSVEVNKPGEIDEIFDQISYEKGGSVLTMLEDYVGKEAFRKGVSAYLKAHAYSNGKGEDLWNSLSRNSGSKGLDVERVAKAWLTNPGFPSIKVERAANGLRISQSVYRINGSEKGGSIWPIPVHYKFSDGGSGKMLMKGKTALIDGKHDWVKLNFGQHGLYRVEYDEESLHNLCEACSNGKLGEVDAWGIEEDMFSLARSGRIALNEYISNVGKYFLGIGYPVNLSLVSNLNWVYSISYGMPFANAMHNIKFRLAKSLFDKYGFRKIRGEPSIVPILRSAAISSLGIAGYDPVVAQCRKLFASPKLQTDMSDIRSAVYDTIAWNGGRREAASLMKRYMSSRQPQEKSELLTAMSMHRQPELIKKTLDFSISGKVRPQDSISVPIIVGGSPAGKDYVWQWTSRNWKKLMGMYDEGTHMLAYIVKSLSLQSDAKTRKEIAAFFSRKENMRDDIKRSVKQTLEYIDANIKFMEINRDTR